MLSQKQTNKQKRQLTPISLFQFSLVKSLERLDCQRSTIQQRSFSSLLCGDATVSSFAASRNISLVILVKTYQGVSRACTVGRTVRVISARRETKSHALFNIENLLQTVILIFYNETMRHRPPVVPTVYG